MFNFARFWYCWLFKHICIARAQLFPSCINCLGAACCMGTLHLHLALAYCIAFHRCIVWCCALHCCIEGGHRVASEHCLLHCLASSQCTLHGHFALATCTGMLLCTASVHRLLHCTAWLHCSVHCIALRLRLQVRCYFWCRGCNCCMGSAGQALPPIIHMHKRVIPLTQQTLLIVASYV